MLLRVLVLLMSIDGASRLANEKDVSATIWYMKVHGRAAKIRKVRKEPSVNAET